MERNNVVELKTVEDLSLTLGQLIRRFHQLQDRQGLARIVYKDSFDDFNLCIQETNKGLNVGGFVNNSPSYQLNGLFFGSERSIGEVMLIAACAPADATVEEFFS